MNMRNKSYQNCNLIPIRQFSFFADQTIHQNNQPLLATDSFHHKKIGKVQRFSTETTPQQKYNKKNTIIQNLLKQKLCTQPNPQEKNPEKHKNQVIKIFNDSLRFKKKYIAPQIKTAKETIQQDQQRKPMRWSGHQFYRKIRTAIKKQSKKKYQTHEGFYRYKQKKHHKTYCRLVTHDINEETKINQGKQKNQKVINRNQSMYRFQRNPSCQIKNFRKNTTPYWDDYQQALRLNETKQRLKKQEQRKKKIEDIINSSQILNKKTKSQLIFFFQSKNRNSMSHIQRDKNIMKMRNIRSIKTIKQSTNKRKNM